MSSSLKAAIISVGETEGALQNKNLKLSTGFKITIQ